MGQHKATSYNEIDSLLLQQLKSRNYVFYTLRTANESQMQPCHKGHWLKTILMIVYNTLPRVSLIDVKKKVQLC